MHNMYDELGEKFEDRLLTIGSKFIQASEETFPKDFAVDLGKLPVTSLSNEDIMTANIMTAQFYNIIIHIKPEELEKWRTAYQEDSHFKDVIESLQEPQSHILPRYPQYQYSNDGLLFFEDSNGNSRLCVPEALRISVMDQAHNSLTESAHGGYYKCYNHLASTHYWPGMSRDLRRYVNTCDICQKSKPRHHGPIGLLQPIPIPTRPFEVVSMDFIPELPEASGYDNILVIVDKLTKYAFFIPCNTKITDDETARLFHHHIISKFGIPSQIITDRDAHWKNGFWKEVCQLMGMKRALTTSYHPQADGQTEILNQGLEIALQAYIGPNRNDWNKYLDGLELSYNTSPHTSTGYSPAYLLFGFHPTTESTLLSHPSYIPRPLGDMVSNGGEPDEVHLEHEDDRAVDMVEQFEAKRTRAKEALTLSRAFQERNYNKGRLLTEFKEGDFVLLNPHTLELLKNEKGCGKKLLMRYDGPFEVIRKLSPVTYQLRLPASYRMHPIINIAHLEKYQPSTPDLGTRPTRDLNRSDFEELPEVEVEKILNKRMFKAPGKHRRVKKFRVRFKGLPASEDEWKTSSELKNAPLVLQDWIRRKNIDN